MPDTGEVIKIFVSYSHHDSAYLEDNFLLGYLKGLEKEQIEFWTDRQIGVGELWDEVIKTHIQEAHIALVLVSQSFLELCLLSRRGNPQLSRRQELSVSHYPIALRVATPRVAAQPSIFTQWQVDDRGALYRSRPAQTALS